MGAARLPAASLWTFGLQAFLIAFTSSFLPRLYYRYTRDPELSGFINFTLATAPRNHSLEHRLTCR